MEKKLKYFLGLFIVGFGLLINQSFGYSSTAYIEGVVLPWNSSSMRSSSYLYRFTAQNGFISVQSNRYYYLGYTSLHDGVTDTTYGMCDSTSNCPTRFFNNSVFGQEIYTGWQVAGSVHYLSSNSTNTSDLPLRIAFGNGTDFGKNFIYVNSLINNTGVLSPHYMLGGGYFTSNNFTDLDTSNLYGPLRIFFNQGANLSSPLDGLNLAQGGGTNLSGSIAWQYFTRYGFKYQTRNQSQAQEFGDLGGSYNKGKTFGGYGMGYSYVIRGSNDLSWNNFSFVSVGSRCVESAMNLGFSSFNGLTGCQNVGLLVLKGDSYAGFNNNASVIVLSKNSANRGQILYEQFSCAEDDTSRIFNESYCTSIGHGYITHGGTGNVLPFNRTGFYALGNGNEFLDFMFQGSIHGYITISNNQYCLNGSNGTYCFGLTSTPNGTSIKEQYLGGNMGGGIITTTTVYQDFYSSCVNDAGFYALNKVACDGMVTTIGQPVELSGSNGLYTSYGVNSSGNVVQWITYQEDFQNTGYQFVEDANGNGYYVCIDPRGCDSNFGNTGVVSSGNVGNMSTLKSYFRDWFEGGFFFSCPFPYGFGEMEEVNVLGTKVFFSTIGRDFLYPLYCMGAGFKAGKNVEFFSGVNNLLDGRLFSSSDYTALYNLFDIIISLGILFLIIKIYHLLN